MAPIRALIAHAGATFPKRSPSDPYAAPKRPPNPPPRKTLQELTPPEARQAVLLEQPHGHLREHLVGGVRAKSLRPDRGAAEVVGRGRRLASRMLAHGPQNTGLPAAGPEPDPSGL